MESCRSSPSRGVDGNIDSLARDRSVRFDVALNVAKEDRFGYEPPKLFGGWLPVFE